MREQVKPKRLGAVGPELFPGCGLCHVERDSVVRHRAAAPRFPSSSRLGPAESADMRLRRLRQPHAGHRRHPCGPRQAGDRRLRLRACDTPSPKRRRTSSFDIRLNITTPYMPITSDGKEPDLEPFLDEISDAVAKAVRKARRPDAKAEGTSQKDVVLDNLDDVIAAVSGEEGYRFNARQLFYALRPIVMDETGEELKIANFTKIITDYESRERRNPADVPRAARLDHASAPRRDHHARHPDGRGVRAPGMDFQQAALHREGRRAWRRSSRTAGWSGTTAP